MKSHQTGSLGFKSCAIPRLMWEVGHDEDVVLPNCQSVECMILSIVAYTRLPSPYSDLEGSGMPLIWTIWRYSLLCLQSTLRKKKQGIEKPNRSTSRHRDSCSTPFIHSFGSPLLAHQSSSPEHDSRRNPNLIGFTVICGYEILWPVADLRGLINVLCPCSVKKRNLTNSWPVV